MAKKSKSGAKVSITIKGFEPIDLSGAASLSPAEIIRMSQAANEALREFVRLLAKDAARTMLESGSSATNLSPAEVESLRQNKQDLAKAYDRRRAEEKAKKK